MNTVIKYFLLFFYLLEILNAELNTELNTSYVNSQIEFFNVLALIFPYFESL